MIENLLACATCANNFKDGGPDAAGWSILFMLGMIVPMLGGVVFFMARLIRKGQKSLDPELCDDFDPYSATR